MDTNTSLDITMLIIYTTRTGRQLQKEVPASKVQSEVQAIWKRGGRSIKVL